MSLYRDHAHRSEDDITDRFGFLFASFVCRSCRASYLGCEFGPEGFIVLWALDTNAVCTAPYKSGAPWIAGVCTCGDAIHLAWRYTAVTSGLRAIHLDPPPALAYLN